MYRPHEAADQAGASLDHPRRPARWQGSLRVRRVCVARRSLTSLERTISATDKETVSHPKHGNAHDDVATAVCGAIVWALKAAKHAAFESKIVSPIVAGTPRSPVPGGYSFGSDAFVAPTIGALTVPPPAPVAPATPPAAPGQSWTGPKDGPCPWLKKPASVTQRVDGGPPQTKSGAETKLQMERTNADKSIEFRVMGAPKFTW